MVKKKLTLRHAIAAFLITLLIFLAGAGIGYFVNEEKSHYLENRISSARNQNSNMQLELLYIDVMGEEHACSVLGTEVQETSSKLTELGQKLQAYQDAKDFGTKFFQLKDEYMFMQIRTWLMYEKMQKTCNTNLNSILYFYSSEYCSSCEGQGKILSALKKKHGQDLLIFSLDTEWSQPILKAIKNDFNVTRVPTLIINGEKHAGFQSQEDIEKELT